jgi:hypothetical protein
MSALALKMRNDLSAPGLLGGIRKTIDKIPDTCKSRSGITLSDCVMSGLAIFGLKYPSLLQFDQAKADELIAHNLKTLYQVEQIPSDTFLRERLDKVEPIYLRKAFKKVFSLLQRGKALEQFSYIDDHYLISIDGTGYFSSSKIHCSSCCVKEHYDGKKTYYHQMLGAVIVHPGY